MGSKFAKISYPHNNSHQVSYCIAGKFRIAQNFAFFAGLIAGTKIRTCDHQQRISDSLVNALPDARGPCSTSISPVPDKRM